MKRRADRRKPSGVTDRASTDEDVRRPFPGRLLIEDEPAAGAWNMAFDGALLDGALERHETILRIYRWSEATLSLGHFQKQVPRNLPRDLVRCPWVRRLSGGGAILHHHEWTYSCVVPPGHPLAARGTILYEVVHEALVAALTRRGISAHLRGTDEAVSTGQGASPGEQFQCYRRADARDILVAGRKITGSAQRRRRGAVLQHGSVLLRASPLAPRIPGLFNLVNLDLNLDNRGLTDVARQSDHFAREAFIELLAPRLFTDPPDRTFHADDLARAEEILKSQATPALEIDEELR